MNMWSVSPEEQRRLACETAAGLLHQMLRAMLRREKGASSVVDEEPRRMGIFGPSDGLNGCNGWFIMFGFNDGSPVLYFLGMCYLWVAPDHGPFIFYILFSTSTMNHYNFL